MARTTRKLSKEELEQREAHKAEVLTRLAELSESSLTDDQVERTGNKLILPATMELGEAYDFLGDYIQQQETNTEFSRTFRYRPFDGAVALQRALLRATGSTGLAKGTWSWFGYQPPELISINVSVDETLQVPWGRIAVPMVDGVMSVTSVPDTTWGPLFHLSIVAPRKYKAPIEGLFKIIEEELKADSIYKGKAIDGQTTPEFLDLSGVNPDEVIYADATTRQLSANIWSVIRHTAQMRRRRLPRKRAVMLEGPYGTGKTLGAFLTAKEAVENDWTFLYCRPGRDDFATVMSTARLYQPSIVFYEDVDRMTEEGADRDAIAELLDIFDGITAKSTEIMVVLTTNHKERINKAMLRPGRLDAVIHIGEWDQSAVQRMLEHSVPAEDREPDLDYSQIWEAMEGFLPAFVKEALDRAQRYSIDRNDGELGTLSTQDFVDAAESLREQLDLMEGAKEGKGPESLTTALQRTVGEAIHGSPIVDTADNHVLTLETAGSTGTNGVS